MRGPTAGVEQQDIAELRRAIETQTRVLSEIRDLLLWATRDDPYDKTARDIIVETRRKAAGVRHGG